MVKWIVLGVIGYLLMWFITLVLMVYTDRKDGASPNFVYRNEDFVEYMGFSLLWFIILPVLLACYCATGLKKIVATIVETMIARDKFKENKGKNGK